MPTDNIAVTLDAVIWRKKCNLIGKF